MDMKPREDELQTDPLGIPMVISPYCPRISNNPTGFLTNNRMNNPTVHSERSTTKHFVIAPNGANPQSTVVKGALMRNLNQPPSQKQQLQQPPPGFKLRTPKLGFVQQQHHHHQPHTSVSYSGQLQQPPLLQQKQKQGLSGVPDKVNVECKDCSSSFSSLKLFINHLIACSSHVTTDNNKSAPRIKKVNLKTKDTQTPSNMANNNNNNNNTTTTIPSTPYSSLRPSSTSTTTSTTLTKNNEPRLESDKNEVSKSIFVNVRCFGCDENFRSKEAMKLHLSPADRVKCPRCPDRFDLYCSLRKHIVQHTKKDVALKVNTSQPPAKSYKRKHSPITSPVVVAKRLKTNEEKIQTGKEKDMKQVKNNNNNNINDNNNNDDGFPASPLSSLPPYQSGPELETDVEEEEEQVPKVDESALPFPCSRKFRKRNTLAAHKLLDHGEGFKCTADPLNCSYEFTQQYNLDSHLKKYHTPGSQIIPPPQEPLNPEYRGGKFRMRGSKKNGIRLPRETRISDRKIKRNRGRPRKDIYFNSTIPTSESPNENDVDEDDLF